MEFRPYTYLQAVVITDLSGGIGQATSLDALIMLSETNSNNWNSCKFATKSYPHHKTGFGSRG